MAPERWLPLILKAGIKEEVFQTNINQGAPAPTRGVPVKTAVWQAGFRQQSTNLQKGH